MEDIDDRDSLKSHKEIIRSIDEIREFENEYYDFEIEEKKQDIKRINESIEVEHKTLFYSDDLLDEGTKNKFFDKLRKVHFTRSPERGDEKPVNPAIFNIGFNKNGDLVNLDFKITDVKKEKGSFNIKNLFRRKKDEKTSTDSKFGKLKSKLGKISKLKKVIPSRSKNEEEKESGDEE